MSMNSIRQSDSDKATDNGFSNDRCVEMKYETLARIRGMSATITQLAMGVEQLDIALQSHMAIRSIDSQQAQTAAARNLASLLEGGADV